MEIDPTATPTMLEFAGIWKDMAKIVFSGALEQVDWNSRLVRDDAIDEVRRLKADPGSTWTSAVRPSPSR